MTDNFFTLRKKLNRYRQELYIHYKSANEILLMNIVSTAKIHVKEGIILDEVGWTSNGHGLIFYLEEDIYSHINSIEGRNDIGERIKQDLNKISRDEIYPEYIGFVSIGLFHPEDQDCQKVIEPLDTYQLDKASSNDKNLEFWKPGYLKLFISHQSKYKEEVSDLANFLLDYAFFFHSS